MSMQFLHQLWSLEVRFALIKSEGGIRLKVLSVPDSTSNMSLWRCLMVLWSLTDPGRGAGSEERERPFVSGPSW
jgi:hypothetical protein